MVYITIAIFINTLAIIVLLISILRKTNVVDVVVEVPEPQVHILVYQNPPEQTPLQPDEQLFKDPVPEPPLLDTPKNRALNRS